METIEHSIDIDVPLRTAYNQYTQFEEFPEFMEGVEEVRQLDDKRLHWVASIAGKRHEWDAEIIEQTPDERIAWRNVSGKKCEGSATFARLGENSMRLTVRMSHEPEGVMEKVGSAAGMASARVKGDLQRFKDFIEGGHQETGAWRGEIHGTDVIPDPNSPRSKRLRGEVPVPPGTTPGGASGKM